jgi:hypothetical protein
MKSFVALTAILAENVLSQRTLREIPMSEGNHYGWKESLEKIIQSSIEEIREGLKRDELAVARHMAWRARLRNRMARAVTAMEMLAIQVVSCLYFVEKTIRALLRSTFASPFLKLYQKLTASSVALIDQKLSAVAVPEPLPLSKADGTGGLTVAMLLTSADKKAVEALLPAGLGLSSRDQLGALRDQVSEGKYPVMIGLGYNAGVRPVWNKKSFVKMNYLELSIGVPGVLVTREFPDCPQGPFFYIPALLLNSITPTLLGWAFGFKKRLKRFKADAFSYRVSRLWSGRPLLVAQVTSDPSIFQLANNVEELAPWLDFLNKPIVTRTWWGDLRFTFFFWDWRFTPTSPARVDFSFSTGEFPLFPVGPAAFTSLAETNSENAGAAPTLGKAYLMSVPWRLLLPFRIGVLKLTARFRPHTAGNK